MPQMYTWRMDVGVAEFRARLSELLERVRHGDELVVTDRGVPIARVVGIDASTKLVRLTDEGVIGRPRSGKRPVARDRTRPRPRRSVAEHVTEQRR